MLRMLGVTKRRAFSALLVLAGKPYHETNAKHVEEPYYHETRWYYYYYYFCPSEASNLSTPSDSTPRRSSLNTHIPFPQRSPLEFVQAGLRSGVRGDPIYAREQPHVEVRLDGRVRQSPHGLPAEASKYLLIRRGQRSPLPVYLNNIII